MLDKYITVQGDMWDSISKRLYGTEAALNVLLEANQQYADIVMFPAGIMLRIPKYIAPNVSTLPPWRR